MKPFKRRKKSAITLNIAPLLDVMFMLLLFFMLTSHFMKPSFSLSLPKASNASTRESEEIILAINKDGSLFLNDQQITRESLHDVLAEKIRDSEKKRVVFYGDSEIRYKDFIAVMDILKQSGAETIDVAHDTTL